jgi:hypothetical protein
MLAVASKTMRESLVEEISNAVRQWTEREREIFSQAHYQGQSHEAISQSFHLRPEEVSAILQLCEQKLHSSLRDFRKTGNGTSSPVPAEDSCASFCTGVSKVMRALSPKIQRIPDAYRKSA